MLNKYCKHRELAAITCINYCDPQHQILPFVVVKIEYIHQRLLLWKIDTFHEPN